MAPSIPILSSSLAIFLGIFAGVFLAYHTCEELKSLEKILKISRYLLYLIGAIIVSYSFLEWNTLFFISLVLIAIFATILSKIKITRKQEIIIDNILLIIFIIVFVIKQNILIGGITFLLGIIIGTIETKELLFKKYKSEKFTTLTMFNNKDKIFFYMNVFKKHQIVLYITFLFQIIISII